MSPSQGKGCQNPTSNKLSLRNIQRNYIALKNTFTINMATIAIGAALAASAIKILAPPWELRN
ncbi:MAG: hypothetical protein P0S96_00675 [Simkaniaceae bacterium]|nr:hypothetical protein [Candidatus Sacchlamyda saccharinae]